MLASAASSIPEFGGDRKTFADFDFKLKAVAYDLGLDVLVAPKLVSLPMVAPPPNVAMSFPA